MIRLGEGGFESGEAAGAFTILLTQTLTQPVDNSLLRGLDCSEPRTPAEKAVALREEQIVGINQLSLLRGPDSRVLLGDAASGRLLADYAEGLVGLQTSDDPFFTLAFWEIGAIDSTTVLSSWQ